MRLYHDFHTEQLSVPPFSSPTEVPLNKNVSEDPLNTSNEITTPMYGGKQRKSRRGGKQRKSTRKSKKLYRRSKSRRSKSRRSKSRRSKSRRSKSRQVIRGGFSLPPFLSDFTRGVQYGAEQLYSDITTAPLALNRNPNVSTQPYLQSPQ
jgi:hypothetical protein